MTEKIKIQYNVKIDGEVVNTRTVNIDVAKFNDVMSIEEVEYILSEAIHEDLDDNGIITVDIPNDSKLVELLLNKGLN